MSKDWTEKLSEKMEQHQMPLPDNLWDDIEKRIQEQQDIKKKRHNRIIWIGRITGIAAAILVALVFSHELLERKSVTPEDTNTAHKSSESKNQGKTLAEKKSDEQTKESTHHNNEQIAYTKPSTNLGSQLTEKANNAETITAQNEKEYQASESSLDKTEENAKPDSNNENASNEQTKDKDSKPNNGTSISTKKEQNYNEYIKPHHSQSGWSGGLYASNIPFSSSGSNYNDSYMSGEGTLGTKDFDLKHDLPINIGINARYNFTRKLSLETGITYSYHKSEYDSDTFECEQELHYIGIPVRLNYTLWENKRFIVYLAAGGKAEKCISGNRDYNYKLDIKQHESENISEKEIQWSANASAGIQCNITKNLGIYVEPGVSHYFDNGSNIDNIYKDRPTNFNLNLGVRFTP